MELNEKQQQVVNEIDRNIILLASAGTGKTDTLSRRIANVIKKGRAVASDILCITFTNKAAKEMKDRVVSIVSEGSNGITIKTFHSFCFDIIKSEAKRNTDIFTDFIIFDEDDCKDIINQFKSKDFPSDNIQRFIGLVKEDAMKLECDYTNAVDYIFKNKKSELNYICTQDKTINCDLRNYLFEEGVNIVEKYNRLLIDNHGLDFNDLIIRAKDILEDESVVKRLREKYKYINIDEVQDTSIIEYSIIEKIFYKNNILLCGDKFQTIYQWRGSEPNKIFIEFRDKYKPFEIAFNKNYRATRNLTDASMGYLINAFREEVQDIYGEGLNSAAKESGDKIVFKENDSLYGEAVYIYKQINELYSRGEDLSRTCVLTRDNGYNTRLSTELSYIKGDGRNFEFILVDQFKFFRRMEIKDIISFMKLIGNRHDSVSFKRILKRLPTGIGDKTIEIVESDSYKKAGIVISDFLDKKTLKGEFFTLLIDEFEKDNIIVFDVESTGVDVTGDEIIQIAAIKINSKGETIDVFEKFIVPSKSVGDSYFVHGFNDDFLRENGEDKSKVLSEFVEFSKGAVIVGHNVQYDINILTSELTRNKVSQHEFKGFYDTLDIYRRFHNNIENHKLETLSRVFDVKNKPDHNAMNDILATAELLVRAIKKDIIPTSFERISYIERHLKTFEKISNMLNELFEYAKDKRPHDIIFYIIKKFDIGSLYKQDELDDKMERLRDFYKLVKDLDSEDKGNSDALLDILKITALSNGELERIIIKRSGRIRVPIITVHQSKGLEYENVFIAGLQDNTFPSYMAVKNNDFEEEKRTFYVAITRAKKRLFLSCNTDAGRYKPKDISRFVGLIPSNFIKFID
ncbi:MAG: 3'-5' exonuclease [Clostridium sp.]